MDIDDEIAECAGWKLKVGDIGFYTNTKEKYLETLAFIRVLGYLITDGTITYNKLSDMYIGNVSVGHILDVEGFLNDLKLFCEVKQNKFKVKNYYRIRIPNTFMKNILNQIMKFNQQVYRIYKWVDFISFIIWMIQIGLNIHLYLQ